MGRVAFGFAVGLGAALAAAGAGPEDPSKFKVLDLVFRVEDIGAKVQDLKIRESKTEIRMDLAADVLFDFDKDEIKPAASEALRKVADVIREKGRGLVRIEGHTDARGSDAYNDKLSLRRADAVRRWLVEKEKLGPVRFETSGRGAKRPVAPNQKPDGSDDPEGRQKNRRVEIVVRKA